MNASEMPIANKDELREEYDFSQMDGTRGKHYAQYKNGTNLVLLAQDVAERFPISEAVNEALRRSLSEEQEAV